MFCDFVACAVAETLVVWIFPGRASGSNDAPRPFETKTRPDRESEVPETHWRQMPWQLLPCAGVLASRGVPEGLA